MTVVYEDEWVTLHHADYRDHLDVLEALDVDAVITDPPYGETNLDWDRWVKDWPADAARVSDVLWCFGSFRMFWDHRDEFRAWKLAQELVWEKHNGSGFAKDRFKRVHELPTMFYRGEWADIRHEVPKTADASARTVRRKTRPAHTGNIEASTYRSEDGGPRLMRSVIYCPSEHGKKPINETQKPEGIVRPLIEYSVPPGGLIVDLFSGSGTTALVARQSGRRCIAFEKRRGQAEKSARRLAQQTFVFTALEAS